MTLSQLSKLGATKFRTRLNEPFGQRQSAIYSALGADCGGYYTAHHLPCLNHALPAAKTTSKDKQPLSNLQQICPHINAFAHRFAQAASGLCCFFALWQNFDINSADRKPNLTELLIWIVFKQQGLY
ncbi:hypothetical protein L9G74_16575 [Shewanella sp. C32]|uniref:Uncharacterized protein n=1 Tax=Shewanella electrica TaxID=515560 RepID=A0ABT2FP75_9GAMM|nr:hypothetical protein [Shewanella electrica]MCH1925698.1 hypothetical protein [Shewanella electrica]MCS4558053.1 hypothetical protein [Shewanella electrica]